MTAKYKKLTKQRKAELDNYSEEDVNYFWNIFTQEELDYLKDNEH
jgi:hypothetical protein